jgi:hypothetical protein
MPRPRGGGCRAISWPQTELQCRYVVGPLKNDGGLANCWANGWRLTAGRSDQTELVSEVQLARRSSRDGLPLRLAWTCQMPPTGNAATSRRLSKACSSPPPADVRRVSKSRTHHQKRTSRTDWRGRETTASYLGRRPRHRRATPSALAGPAPLQFRAFPTSANNLRARARGSLARRLYGRLIRKAWQASGRRAGRSPARLVPLR